MIKGHEIYKLKLNVDYLDEVSDEDDESQNIEYLDEDEYDEEENVEEEEEDDNESSIAESDNLSNNNSFRLLTVVCDFCPDTSVGFIKNL